MIRESVRYMAAVKKTGAMVRPIMFLFEVRNYTSRVRDRE
jgi:hypothetical protein